MHSKRRTLIRFEKVLIGAGTLASNGAPSLLWPGRFRCYGRRGRVAERTKAAVLTMYTTAGMFSTSKR